MFFLSCQEERRPGAFVALLLDFLMATSREGIQSKRRGLVLAQAVLTQVG